MAKRKSKKKVSFNIVPVVLLVLAVLVIALGSLAGVTADLGIEGVENPTYTLYQVTFGHEYVAGGVADLVEGKTAIDFSFLACLGMFLPLVGAVIALALRKKKLGGILSLVCFLGSAILLFLVPQVTSVTSTLTVLGKTTTTTKSMADLGWTLGIGSIITGAISGVGTLLSVVHIVKAK